MARTRRTDEAKLTRLERLRAILATEPDSDLLSELCQFALRNGEPRPWPKDGLPFPSRSPDLSELPGPIRLLCVLDEFHAAAHSSAIDPDERFPETDGMAQRVRDYMLKNIEVFDAAIGQMPPPGPYPLQDMAGMSAELNQMRARIEANTAIGMPSEVSTPASRRDAKRVATVPGDVVELTTPKGYAYFQVAHLHALVPAKGPAVRVLAGLFKSRPSDLDALVSGETVFWLLFDPTDALRHGAATKVGTFAIPHHAMSFPTFREPMGATADGRTIWGVWRGGEAIVQRIEAPLSDEARAWGILEAVSTQGLVNRIVRGWRPDRDV